MIAVEESVRAYQGFDASRPIYMDESNWEEEAHLNKRFCGIEHDIHRLDKDMCCENHRTREEMLCENSRLRDEIRLENEKTRALIENNYVQGLRDKLAEKDRVITEMKSAAYADAKFDQVFGVLGATNAKLNHIECEIPKRAPVYAQTVTPDTHLISREYDTACATPRRGVINDDFWA